MNNLNGKENKNNRGATILLLLLLLGSVGFNVYQYRNHTTTVIQYTHEEDSLINMRIEVERELVAAEMELDKYKGIAGNLDSLVSDANEEIAQKEQRIRQLISSEKNLQTLNKKLKAELAELKTLRDEYLDRIDVLMTENKALTEQNAQLTNKVENLSSEKSNLEKKVATGSKLKAEYVKVTSFKKKSSGKLVESLIAKRVNKLDVCFTVMDNKIAQHGERIAYLRILSPNGKPLMGLSKGQFELEESHETIEATSNLKLNYEGEKQNICLAYENDERILESGTYIIELYLDNTMVYSGSYVLR